MKSISIFSSVCLVLLLACNNSPVESASKASTSTLFAEYYIRYLEEEGQLRAQVSYLEGDSLSNAQPIALSSVFFQGGAMEMRKLNAKSIRYRSERVMPYTPPFNFTYNLKEGAAAQHDLIMDPILDFSLEGDLRHSGQTVLQWEGKPLKAEEAIVLIFTDQKNQTSAINVVGPSKDTRVVIRGEDLKKLTPGEIKFYLVKKKKTQEQSENTVNSSTVEFYTKTAITQLRN